MDGCALPGQALQDLQPQFEAHDLGRAFPPGGPEGLRVSCAPEEPVGLPADPGLWIGIGGRILGQRAQHGFEKAGIGMVPHMGQAFPNQVPLFSIQPRTIPGSSLPRMRMGLVTTLPNTDSKLARM